jgi:arylsulfatase
MRGSLVWVGLRFGLVAGAALGIGRGALRVVAEGHLEFGLTSVALDLTARVTNWTTAVCALAGLAGAGAVAWRGWRPAASGWLGALAAGARAASEPRGVAGALFALAALNAAAWGVAATRNATGPNLVLISVDTLRADHVGLYGYGINITPNLDAFFRNATIYAQASSSAPCTMPAVAQLLTGARDHAGPRPRLAEWLAEQGYRTGAVVSQHLFVDPLGAARGVARGFEQFDIQAWWSNDHHHLTKRTAREVSDRAIAWLQANAGDGPFFLWLHYFDPHDPYEPPVEDEPGAPRVSTPSGDRRTALMRGKREGEHWMEAGHVFSAKEVGALVRLYDAEIRYTDAQVGRVLETLAELEIVSNTVVVFTADHGERLGEDDRWDHCQSLHQRELHVPLLVRVRGGKLGDARVVSSPVSTLDVVPTVLALTGIERPDAGLDGVDLREAPPERSIVSIWSDEAAVRRGPWKLRVTGRDSEGRARLYRLDRDPDETNDLARERAELRRALAAELTRASDLEGEARRTRETLERLRALGYVE